MQTLSKLNEEVDIASKAKMFDMILLTSKMNPINLISTPVGGILKSVIPGFEKLGSAVDQKVKNLDNQTKTDVVDMLIKLLLKKV